MLIVKALEKKPIKIVTKRWLEGVMLLKVKLI